MSKKEKIDHKKVTVTQIASPIGRGDNQQKNLIGLGLNKIGRTRTLIATQDVVGMINKVQHLLKVQYL
jgi:large subunit ribosomal protein L30